ncbi:MAG: glycosyltransferase family 4 protein [Jaaginema sp. PMC 1079.18]|nr:glycosyltransferase family 4 protein [Jaaginema sp. PMC 1080.18]MEC4853295.1 glycosyltransferase family 4 protein [Jaaginema sp. PMC 1079.18]MEC4869106.1 glycosyltransferase family 4 protein [Jaaginema sp. PMC 1078.18]
MNLIFLGLIVLSFTIAFFSTAYLKTAFQTKLLDIPNDRSSHTQPTPRGGGLGFLVAFAIATLLSWVMAQYTDVTINLNPQPGYIGLVLLPLAVTSFLDDRNNLPARIRYLVQLSSAGIAIACFGLPFSPEIANIGQIGQVLIVILTAIAFTALINFYNFMDGLDGLVASVTALQFGFLAIYLNQPIWSLLVAALLGFLYWNWSPAKIFMGDVGSTVLGGSIAIALLNATSTPQLWPACAITLPLIGDAIYTLIRRLLKRENIFQAHRTHLYQRLQQSGWSHSKVAIAYLVFTTAISILIATLGLLGSELSLGLTLVAIVSGEIYLNSQEQLTHHKTNQS